MDSKVPDPDKLTIQRGGTMMLLAANASQTGMGKGPMQRIFGRGGKGQPILRTQRTH